MPKKTHKSIIILFALLMFSTFTLSVYVFENIGFITQSRYWLYFGIIGILALIGNIHIYKYKQSQASFNISLVFIALSIFTLISTPFREYPLGSIIGATPQLQIGAIFFVIAPLIIKIVDYIKSNNSDIIEIIVAVFIICRGLLEIIVPGSISNSDFLGFTGLFAIAIIAPNLKLKKWNDKYEIVKIAGLLSAFVMVLLSDSRSAVFSILVIPISVYIFYLIINKILAKNITVKIISIIPVAIIIFAPVIILTLYGMDLIAPDKMITLWQRAVMINSAWTTADIQTLLFGNGWGLNDLLIRENAFVDGVSNTLNNQVNNNIQFQTLGAGISHIHNELFEYLFGGGIISAILYLFLWGVIGYYARTNILLICFVSAVALHYGTWFIHTTDVVLLITLLALIAKNHNSETIKGSKIQNGCKRYGLVMSIVAIIFSFIYIPYINKMKYQMATVGELNSWYGLNASGMLMERKLWRTKFLNNINKLKQDQEISQQQLQYSVDILGVLKNQAFNYNNKTAIYELSALYDALYDKHSQNKVLEDFRKYEFKNWATALLLVAKTYPNRFDTSINYLNWHLSRNEYNAVDEVTKRLLKINPENAVALYWRGLLFIKHDNDLGHKMLEDAFRLNITRYQTVKPEIYNKYKHLLDRKYR